MKRDMDLVRKILLACEQHEHGRAPNRLQIDGYTDEEIGYHAYIMEQAGLVEACDVSHSGSHSPEAIITSLTWDGHEFLGASKDEGIWSKAKEAVGATGGMALDVLKSVLVGLAADAAKKAAGLP